jgi:flagellar biosynthesis/type III secretory pathway chaperone
MPNPAAPDLVNQVADAVAKLRVCLEQLDMKALEESIANAQLAIDALNAFPGGAEAVRSAINSLPEPDRDTLAQKLEEARQDQDINAELIRLAMQRNAALQAHFAQQSDSATYSQEGGVPVKDSGKLLGRF